LFTKVTKVWVLLKHSLDTNGENWIPADVKMSGSNEKCPTVDRSRNCDASVLLSDTNNLQQQQI